MPEPVESNDYDPSKDYPLPAANDPGGANAKGYGADPDPGAEIPAVDPIPLADAAGHVHKPIDGDLPPTGRAEAEGPEKGRILGGGA